MRRMAPFLRERAHSVRNGAILHCRQGLRRRNLFAPGLMKPVRAQVALTAIGKNGENTLSRPEFAGGNAAGMKDRASRYAAEDTFLFREAVGCGSGFFVGHCNNPID